MKKDEVNSLDEDKIVEEATLSPDDVDKTSAEAKQTDDAQNGAVETVTQEEFEASNAPEAPKKKKFKMKKWQIAVTAVAAVLLIAIIVVLSIFLPLLFRNAPDNDLSAEIVGFNRVETYIGNTSYDGPDSKSKGNTISLEYLFPGATDISIKEDASGILSIQSGNVIKVNAAKGTAKVNVTIDGKTTEETVNVVTGINVFDYTQLKAAAKDSRIKSIVLQKDIDYATKTNGGESITLKKNLYGNTHILNGTPFTKDYDDFKKFKNEYTSDNLIVVGKDDIEINGVHMVGKKLDLKEGDTWQHDEYADGGLLIQIAEKKGILIKNCALERAFKCVWLRGSEVTLEGNLMREVADGCISMETTNGDPNKLTLENNICINPQVAAIIIFNIGNAKPQPAEITMKGFFDVYNWKSKKTAALMPITEGILANIVNNLIGDNLDKPEYKEMMVPSDGTYWLHIAIAILSSGGGGVNEPVINGVKLTNGTTEEAIANISGSDSYIKRQLPFGQYASLLGQFGIVTANMVGYKETPTVADMKPRDANKVLIDTDMFAKLRGNK